MDNKFYITNGVTHDGFGSRIQRCISVMCMVYYLKDLGYPVEYIHTPFSYIGFNEDYRLGESERMKNGNDYPYGDNCHSGYIDRASKWDKYLGFKGLKITDLEIKDSFIVNSPNPLQGFNILRNDILEKITSGKLYVIKMVHKQYDDSILDIEIFNKFRKNILENFSFPLYEKTKKSVAIHIRRKDAINYDSRYLPDSYYTRIIDVLKKCGDKYDITIYTQKIGFDPTPYNGCKIVYDDTQDDYETFVKLVFSDHLIMGKSSFSYAAALLNNNIVVHHGTGHIPLNSWISDEEYINLIKII